MFCPCRPLPPSMQTLPPCRPPHSMQTPLHADPPSMQTPSECRPPPVNRMTDTCKNISFPILCMRSVKIFVNMVKGFKLATSCVRDENARTVSAIPKFMLQCFIRFLECAEITDFNESAAPFRKTTVVCS